MMPTSPDVRPIGAISTPYRTVADCPRWPWACQDRSRVVLDDAFAEAVDDLAPGTYVYLLWWAHQAQRYVLRRRQSAGGPFSGVFTSRGPDRPNPIGLTLVEVLAVEGPVVQIRGADCIDGTALLDIKPAIVTDDRLWQ